MSILTNVMPETISVDGKSYRINTDYRVWIQVEDLICDSSKDDIEVITQILKLCFTTKAGTPLELPKTWTVTIKALFDFYSRRNVSDTESAERQKEISKRPERIYNYDYDADYIYAAFVQQYNIDITAIEMHWWKFRALFAGLTTETKMGKIMEYRSMDLTGIKDKQLLKQYRHAKEIYRLPDNRTEREKENDFANRLCNL